MFGFFDTIVEYLQIIWQFFLTAVNGLTHSVIVLFSSVQNIFILAGSVPFFITTSIYCSLFIIVINYIIGRDNK